MNKTSLKLGISTAYNINRYLGNGGDLYLNAKKLISEIRKIGIDRLELNLEVPKSWIMHIKQLVKQGEISIASVHNFCPAIDPIPEGRSYWSAYLLTSEDESERKQSVELTRSTILLASELGANRVVLHCGEVDMQVSGREVYNYARQYGTKTMLYEKYKLECIKQRESKAEKYFDNLRKSLSEIIPCAQKNNIMLGIENRFYYNEIPLPDELERILKEFPKETVGYWHDTGHAEILKRMGFIESSLIYLNKAGDNICGTHLHDVKELSDHFAPGSGEMDFSIINKYFNEKTTTIIEVHSKVRESEIRHSLKYLNNL